MNVDSGFPDPELEKLLDEEERLTRDRLGQLFPRQPREEVAKAAKEIRDNTNFGPEEIRNRFGQHTPTETTKEMHEAVHGIVTDIASIFDRLLPNGRAKFQALVELEKVLMWANAAISDMEPLVEQ